ncbi:S8 family serine peptidase [Phytomonospora sp. NPDC050363]|uniref:S8 family peptidase n=1 Tax=Phytomonospora sp. NPDC050363 TaxID=3155642 RepID=UPI0033D586CF
MRRLWAGVAAVGILLVWAPAAHADDVRDAEWMVEALRLPEAHRIATGEGVTVGIVDTGVDSTHPDLTGVVVAGKDSWSPAGDGQTDVTGHGTAMASLVAGHGHGDGGGDGVLGVAPGARILSYGAWRPGDEKYDDAELLKGIRWVIDNGADVILLAYGGGTGEPEEEALIDEAEAKGIPVVAPTANALAGEKHVGFPGLFTNVVLAGCSGKDGDYSEVGLEHPAIAVAAPCEGLTSAGPDGGYEDTSGTSKAAATTAGTLALLKSHWPDMSREDMMRQLYSTADDKQEAGRDRKVGYGVINPLTALTSPVRPYDPSNPPHVNGDPVYQSDPPATSSLAPPADSQPPWALIGIVGAAVVGGLVLLVVLSRRRA